MSLKMHIRFCVLFCKISDASFSRCDTKQVAVAPDIFYAVTEWFSRKEMERLGYVAVSLGP